MQENRGLMPLTCRFLSVKQDLLGHGLGKDLEGLLGRRRLHGIVDVGGRGAPRLVRVADRCLGVMIAHEISVREAVCALHSEPGEGLLEPGRKGRDPVGIADLNGTSLVVCVEGSLVIGRCNILAANVIIRRGERDAVLEVRKPVFQPVGR